MLLAALPQTATAQSTPEKRKVNVATASLGLPYLPLIIAQQRKYFADEGLEVEIAAFAGGSKALQSLMGGSSDVASGAYSNTLTMAAKGQKLKNFVVQVRYPALTIAVSKRVADRYKSPKDLKGMKIGVSAPGSSTHMIVNHLLSKGGLTSNDVSIIGVGTSAGAVAAIEKGEIDAIINSDPVMTKLEADNAVKVIAETRTSQGHAGPVRRAVSGGRALRHGGVHREKPEHDPGADQRDRARRTVDAEGDASTISPRTCRPNTCWATRNSISPRTRRCTRRTRPTG